MPRRVLDKKKAFLRLNALEHLIKQFHPTALFSNDECANTIFFNVMLGEKFFVFEFRADGFGYGDATNALLFEDHTFFNDDWVTAIEHFQAIINSALFPKRIFVRLKTC